LPAIEKLKQVTGKDNVNFIKLDLGDPSCATAAKEVVRKDPKLDILFLTRTSPLTYSISDELEKFSCHLWGAKPPQDTKCNGYLVRLLTGAHE